MNSKMSLVHWVALFSFFSSFFLPCLLLSSQESLSSQALLPQKTVSVENSQKHPTPMEKASTQFELKGCCPVCFLDMGAFIEGDEAYRLDYKKKSYLFAGQKQQELFQKNPERYSSSEMHELFTRELEAQLKKLNRVSSSGM